MSDSPQKELQKIEDMVARADDIAAKADKLVNRGHTVHEAVKLAIRELQLEQLRRMQGEDTETWLRRVWSWLQRKTGWIFGVATVAFLTYWSYCMGQGENISKEPTGWGLLALVVGSAVAYFRNRKR